MDRLVLALADPGNFRYLVLEADGVIAGFVCLLLSFPQGWPTKGDSSLPFPRIIDLYVDPDRRGQGLGTLFLSRIEDIAAVSGAPALHLSVDAVENTRVQGLYRRCGFREIGAPVDTTWNFHDSDGQHHCGRAILQEMAKLLVMAELPVSETSDESQIAA
ncbi:N-acetyltransferase family protein [Verrucomicrobiota bacterium sgz303538]